MAETRTLVETTATYRRYEIRETTQGNKKVGEDREPIFVGADANRVSIEAKAKVALAANATYLALPAPTNAQIATQVERLTRECSALIRLMLNQLETSSDT